MELLLESCSTITTTTTTTPPIVIQLVRLGQQQPDGPPEHCFLAIGKPSARK